MIFYKISVLAAASILFCSTNSPAQTALNTAQSEQSNNWMMGGTSMATGAALMFFSCPIGTPGTYNAMMCYVIGPSLVATGIADVAAGNGRSNTINPIDPTTQLPTTTPCDLDPTNPFCATEQLPPGTTPGGTISTSSIPPINGVNPTGNPGGMNPTGSPSAAAMPPAVAAALQQAQQVAAQYGLTNPGDPAAVQAFAASHGFSNTQDAMDSAGGSKMPMDMQAAVDKATADFTKKMKASGYSTSDPGMDGGGGGGNRAVAGKGGGKSGLPDLNSLLRGMAGGSGRSTASVEGLQKNFNGDMIGVAGDDIFKQVSRRYQKKIQDKTLPTSGLLK